MNSNFEDAIKTFPATLERLTASPPHRPGARLPKQGVYVFSENDRAVYVGRSNNIPARYRHHTGPKSRTNEAALALLIARKEMGRIVSYAKGARQRLLEDSEFMNAFERAKEKVRKMTFRAVEERNQERQALLEIYCAMTLEAPFNDFGTH